MAGPLPRLLLDGLRFPESPRWHDDKLWFSDMYGGVVQTVDAAGHVRSIVSVAARPSGLGWLPDGRLLVVSRADRRILRLDSGGLVTHADLAALVTGNLNDMVVAERGRAYVGNFGAGYSEGRPPAPTTLITVEADVTARVAADDLLFPNGSAITPDGARLLVAEGFAGQITSFKEPS